MLQRTSAVAPDKVKEAKRLLEGGDHPGEFLVVENALGVTQWCETVETARLQRRLTGRGGGKSHTLLWLIIAVLIAAAAAAATIYLR
jgi:hypothetical protein